MKLSFFSGLSSATCTHVASRPKAIRTATLKVSVLCSFLGPSVIPPMQCSVEAGICNLCLHHVKRNPSKQVRPRVTSHLGVLATRGPVINFLGFLCPVYTKVGSVSKLI